MHKKKRLPYIIQNLILITIIIVSSLISNLTSFNEYTPFYELTLIFFSSIAYPRALPFISLLTYGIFRDILFAYPIGYSSILFLSFRTVIDAWHTEEESPTIWILWSKFALTLIVAITFQAAILAVVFKYSFVNLLLAFLKRWYFTSLLYPCFHLCYSIIIKFFDKNSCGKTALEN